MVLAGHATFELLLFPQVGIHVDQLDHTVKVQLVGAVGPDVAPCAEISAGRYVNTVIMFAIVIT